jgi:hypothetical protein
MAAMRGAVLAFVTIVLAAGASVQAGRDAAFDAARDQARSLMDVGRWAQARDTLVAALEVNSGERQVFRELTGVRDDLRRCAFALARPTPRPEDVVGGRLVAYRPLERFVSLVYERERAPGGPRASTPTGFPPGDFEEREGRWLHPMELDGTYTLEVTVQAGPASRAPEVYFGLGPAGTLGFTIAQGSVPVLFEGRDGAGRVLAQLERQVLPAAAFELTLRVRPGRVDAELAGAVLSHAAPGVGSGLFGFGDLERCSRIALAGTGDVSWIERRIDERIERERLEFERTYDEDALLPARVREELARRRAASAAAEAGAAAAATEQARAQAEQGARAEAITRLTAVCSERPDLPAPAEELIRQLLLDGRASEAAARLDEAIDRGLWTDGLEQRARALERVRHGPEWRQRFEHASRHYLVRSDVSRELCAEAAEVLDTSRLIFERLLMRAPVGRDAAQRQVYLFAGQAGYLRYAAEMTGKIPAHTAGLYSPVLKQLLIWNLPQRDEMMRTVRHEALHQYMDELGLDAPPWLQEGLGEYFGLAEVARGQVVAGQANARHVAALLSEGAALAPLAEFLHVAPADFYADAGLSYARAWALVHYLQHGGKRVRQIYERLLAELAAGRPARAAVDAAFGAEDLPTFERGLLAHVRGLAVER